MESRQSLISKAQEPMRRCSTAGDLDRDYRSSVGKSVALWRPSYTHTPSRVKMNIVPSSEVLMTLMSDVGKLLNVYVSARAACSES